MGANQRIASAARKILFSITCLILFQAAVVSANELRGLWVDAFGLGFLDRKQVKQLVNDCRKYNFNAIFVQMRKRGDAFYFPKPPNEDPRTQDIAPDFDALQAIINECHSGEQRLAVHCWILGYYAWGWGNPPLEAGHVFNRHPGWFSRDCLGQKRLGEGYYLDPGHPEVSTGLLNIARDIVSRYEVDGLHWDYLRYPGQNSGYNETAVKRYKTEFNLQEDPKPSDSRFCEWRRRQVSDFVRWSTAELLAIKPNVIISASVFASFKDSYEQRFQDWAGWNKEGIIDAIIPMNFTVDTEGLFIPRADFGFTNQWNRLVWMGQGGYKNSPNNSVKQLEYCRKKGLGGTLFYSYRNSNEHELFGATSASDEQENLPDNAQIIIDNTEAEVVGHWVTGEHGKMYGSDYRYKSQGAGQSYVKFKTMLPHAGVYSVSEWHVAGSNRADDATFIITHGAIKDTVKVNQKENGSRWNLLGNFDFDKNNAEVWVSDAGGSQKNITVADAVRFVLTTGAVFKVVVENSTGANRDFLNRSNQQVTLEFIKQEFQPRWEPAPALPWKKNPTKGILKGTVTLGGDPVYNAEIKLSGPSPVLQKTEPHGSFAFFDVSPGRYTIECATTVASSVKRSIQISSGQIVTVDFPLNAALTK